MKKTLLSLAILSIVLVFSSCKKDYEKLIIGTWDNTSTKVDKIDDVAKALFQANITYLQKQKSTYESQIKTMPDSSKAIYEQIMANIDDQLKSLNVDTIKNNIKDNYKIGTFIFNEDKTLTIKSKGDSIVGSWSVSKDTLNLTIQKNQVPLIIKDVSKKGLVLVQNNNLDSLKFDITYYFDKM